MKKYLPQRHYLGCALCAILLTVVNQASMAIDGEPVYHLGGTEIASRGVSSIEIEIAFTFLFQEIFKNTGAKGRITIYPDIDTMLQDIQRGKLDLAYLSALEFIKYQDFFNPDSLISPISNGDLYRQYGLFVNKKDKITDLEQLKDKTLAYTKSDPLGRMFLDIELLENRLDSSDDFFSRWTMYENSNAALIAVFLQQADAALATLNTYNIAKELNPQIAEILTPLIVSEKLLLNVAASGKSVPLTKQSQLKKLALSAHKMPIGHHILHIFHADKMLSITLEALTGVKTLKAKKEHLLKAP